MGLIRNQEHSLITDSDTGRQETDSDTDFTLSLTQVSNFTFSNRSPSRPWPSSGPRQISHLEHIKYPLSSFCSLNNSTLKLIFPPGPGATSMFYCFNLTPTHTQPRAISLLQSMTESFSVQKAVE
eukprot:sb/3475623/